MRRAWKVGSLILVLTLLAAAGTDAETVATDTADKIVVFGTLMTKDGAPVADRTLFLFTVSENQLNLDIKEGRLVNPTAITDNQGKFMVTANGDYIKVGQLFTVGTRMPSGELIVPERAGSSLILKLTSSGRTFDVGAVTVEK